MTPPGKPRRPGSMADDQRDRRRSDSAGMGVPHPVVEEGTPPPQQRPVIALSRSPSPDEVRLKFSAVDAQLEEHREALERVWGARDGAIDKRLDSIERKLDGWAQTAIRNDAMISQVIWPGLQKDVARTDEHATRIAAAERVAAGVERLVEKIEGVADRLTAIETEQALAAERFEAHDARDLEIYELARSTAARVGAVEQRQQTADVTAKVRRANVRPWWWTSKGTVAVITAIGAAIGAVIAAVYAGGCA